jgi:hypothetical protein
MPVAPETMGNVAKHVPWSTRTTGFHPHLEVASSNLGYWFSALAGIGCPLAWGLRKMSASHLSIAKWGEKRAIKMANLEKILQKSVTA